MDERRRQYLEALGIQVWVRRGEFLAPLSSSPPLPASRPTDPAPALEQNAALSLASAEPAVSATVIPERAANCAAPAAARVPSIPAPGLSAPIPPAASDVALLDWDALKARVGQCSRCPELLANRTQAVFGTGRRDAEWMVVGEAPGAEEDARGEPFVGRAGQLLNEMLRAIGHPRETVYIANVLKSRPPNNRDPRLEEVANCEPYLRRQIQLVKPRIILAVGRISAQNLLKTDTPIGKLRGRVHEYEGTPLVVTYHPAYLLRSPLEKRKAWDDLRLALRIFRENAGP